MIKLDSSVDDTSVLQIPRIWTINLIRCSCRVVRQVTCCSALGCMACCILRLQYVEEKTARPNMKKEEVVICIKATSFRAKGEKFARIFPRMTRTSHFIKMQLVHKTVVFPAAAAICTLRRTAQRRRRWRCDRAAAENRPF